MSNFDTNSKATVDVALAEAANRLEVVLVGERKYGWSHKSAGSLIERDDGVAWLRVASRSKPDENRIWNGVVDSGSISGVAKPRVLSWIDWRAGSIEWRAVVLEAIRGSTCSQTPELREAIELPPHWLAELSTSLENLRSTRTERVTCRQDLITRRIRERFGSDVDSRVTAWETCHGDLHWANVTCPQFCILDWEGWGIGPAGLDIAFLVAFSGLIPSIQDELLSTLGQNLRSNNGRISLLFVVSELLRMIDLYGDHPDLEASLTNLGRRALNY